jgi:hypothetical protein
MSPIPIEWDITHLCGHTVRTNLADKPAGQRAGTARWLAKHLHCKACEPAAREAEHQALLAEAALDGMPPLVGGDGAIRWAVRIRQTFLKTAFRELVETDVLDPAVFQRTVLEAARQITAARWWIDNRDLSAADLPELLADPGPAAIGRPSRAATTPTPSPWTPPADTPPTGAGWVSFFEQKANR